MIYNSEDYTVATSGPNDEIVLYSAKDFGVRDASHFFLDDHWRKVAATIWYPAGFGRIVVSDGKVRLGSATISYDGFREVRMVPDPNDKRVAPKEAISRAKSFSTNDKNSSPQLVYKFACQVPTTAPEYSEAQALLTENDHKIRALGYLNGFLVPMHEVCAKVARDELPPSAIDKIQPSHSYMQDANILIERAKAAGFAVSWMLCVDKDGLCGVIIEGDAKAYAKLLFADKQLAHDFAVLGYPYVGFSTINADPTTNQMFMMKPTMAGWVNMSTTTVTVKTPEKVALSEDVTLGLLLDKTPPVYPPFAKAAHISGTVVLQATISKTGSIEDLHVITGPPMLQQAALEAVKTWRYRPYRLNNEPVEVVTTVNVIFALGG